MLRSAGGSRQGHMDSRQVQVDSPREQEGNHLGPADIRRRPLEGIRHPLLEDSQPQAAYT